MKTFVKTAAKMAEKLAFVFTVGYTGMADFRHCSQLFRENSRSPWKGGIACAVKTGRLA